MISIDADVLINFLTGNDVNKIEKLFRRIESRKKKILLTQQVILEIIYTLEYNYKWDRENIFNVVNIIINDPLFKVEEKEDILKALNLYKKTSIPFFDVLKIMKEDVDQIISYNRSFEEAGIKVIMP